MGEPATFDDIIANSPPAHAYDDWTNAVVSKVGNIRVDKLESPQDIGQALKIADNVAGGFDSAKRGKISFAGTEGLGPDLGKIGRAAGREKEVKVVEIMRGRGTIKKKKK